MRRMASRRTGRPRHALVLVLLALIGAGRTIGLAIGRIERGTVKVQEFMPDRMKVSARLSSEVDEGWVSPRELKARVNVQNLFDKKAPFDPYLVLTYGINYNQTWHQAGAVGRAFTLGAKYSF